MEPWCLPTNVSCPMKSQKSGIPLCWVHTGIRGIRLIMPSVRPAPTKRHILSLSFSQSSIHVSIVRPTQTQYKHFVLGTIFALHIRRCIDVGRNSVAHNDSRQPQRGLPGNRWLHFRTDAIQGQRVEGSQVSRAIVSRCHGQHGAAQGAHP